MCELFVDWIAITDPRWASRRPFSFGASTTNMCTSHSTLQGGCSREPESQLGSLKRCNPISVSWAGCSYNYSSQGARTSGSSSYHHTPGLGSRICGVAPTLSWLFGCSSRNINHHWLQTTPISTTINSPEQIYHVIDPSHPPWSTVLPYRSKPT